MRLLLKVHFYTVTVHRAFSILSICNLCIVSEGRNSFYFTLVFGFCWDHFLKYSIFNKYLGKFRNFFMSEKGILKTCFSSPLSRTQPWPRGTPRRGGTPPQTPPVWRPPPRPSRWRDSWYSPGEDQLYRDCSFRGKQLSYVFEFQFVIELKET